jgi:GH25 family lysozyme M1 (1,4-beta-N-acetylmuramidase)
MGAFSLPAIAQPAGYSGVCPDNGPGAGAPAREEKYCPFFVSFNRDTSDTLDERIQTNLGVTSADQTRSIAFLIVIGKYPHIKDGSGKVMDLSAAEADGDNLVNFLINDQKFDEVIVLRDGDATASNINYFLSDYLIHHAADFPNHGRLLIAYSGHGRQTTPTEDAAFLLSEVTNPDGTDNVYPMKWMAEAVTKLSASYFHVATLINACWGGSFFSAGGYGDDDATDQPGALAVTAGSADKTVQALDKSRGSVFFDFLIDGVTRGVGDPQWWIHYGTLRDGKGKPIKKKGLTRLHQLADYLKGSYNIINTMKKSDSTFEKLDRPWIGPTQNGPERGGFFFLTERQTGDETDLAQAYGRAKTQGVAFAAPSASPLGKQAIVVSEQGWQWQVPTWSAPLFPAPDTVDEVPAGPRSSIVGHPEFKVFKSPKAYPIHGFDVSSADGHIDWKTLVDAEHPRFMYMRAIGWRGPDLTFEDRWSKSEEFGVDRGAYVRFDFCKSADSQLAEIRDSVKVDPAALPLAIELVTPSAAQDLEQEIHEMPCLAASGVDSAKSEILKLAAAVHDAYGKTPLLFGNASDLSILLDSRADDYMIWLAVFPRGDGRALVGANPWTLWQTSGTLVVRGIGPRTTGEVFFGTEAQYQEFKHGQGNLARTAVTSGPFIAHRPPMLFDPNVMVNNNVPASLGIGSSFGFDKFDFSRAIGGVMTLSPF